VQTSSNISKLVMQSSFEEQLSFNPAFTSTNQEGANLEHEATDRFFWFHSQFVGSMEMYADPQTVADYLDVHQGWFCRCATPMKVDPLGQNGYALSIGRYGAMGYVVEPKIGLELLPQDERVYRIQTIAVPDYTPSGYEVDFQAVQILADATDDSDPTLTVTCVNWELNLSVGVCFPKLLRALSPKLIQKTGDRLIAQIVKQVSRHLTRKVQEDFHSELGTQSLETFHRVYQQRSSFVCHSKSNPN
jgi:hypothetical protein